MTVSLEKLNELVPRGAMVTDAAVMASYRSDKASIVQAGEPIALVRPTCAEDVQNVMRWATANQIPVVPRGAGTGLAGGASAIDGCIILSMENMDEIRGLDAKNKLIEVEPGVLNADITRAVEYAGLFYPPDPGSREISTIGGNLATNAGGMCCVKYGVTSDYAAGLEIVLSDGRLLKTGGETIKGVAGLDLTRLFVGSEGTLGVITAATLRLKTKPMSVSTFVAVFPTLDSLSLALEDILSLQFTPSFLEFIDGPTIGVLEEYRRMGLDREAAGILIGQADGQDSCSQVHAMVNCCENADASFTFATNDQGEGESLVTPRRLVGLAVMHNRTVIVEDVAVPLSELTAMIRAIDRIANQLHVDIATAGHAGDGNLHPAVMMECPDDVDIRRAMRAVKRIGETAIALGGSITGEHGIGLLKKDMLNLQLDKTARQVHLDIKKALDPRGILNPGKAY